MPVTEIRNPNDMMLVCSIRNGLFSGAGAVVRDLDAAVELILSTLDDGDLYFRAIDVSGKWTPRMGPFDPWEKPGFDVWVKITAKTGLHDQLWFWLDSLIPILEQHRETTFGGLFESENAQLGEVPASLLAVRSRRFVPLFSRFLDVWDLDHGVCQDQTCTDIVEAHGRCPEVDDLLFQLATKHYNTDVFQTLRATLTKHYKGFTGSDLFRRIVTDPASRVAAPADGTETCNIFSYCPNWPELTEAANRILAEPGVR